MHDAYLLAWNDTRDATQAEIAMHRAAGIMVGYLYPAETAGRYEAMSVTRMPSAPSDMTVRAMVFGERTAQAAIRRAANDGASRVWPVRARPADQPGRWRALLLQ